MSKSSSSMADISGLRVREDKLAERETAIRVREAELEEREEAIAQREIGVAHAERRLNLDREVLTGEKADFALKKADLLAQAQRIVEDAEISAMKKDAEDALLTPTLEKSKAFGLSRVVSWTGETLKTDDHSKGDDQSVLEGSYDGDDEEDPVSDLQANSEIYPPVLPARNSAIADFTSENEHTASDSDYFDVSRPLKPYACHPSTVAPSYPSSPLDTSELPTTALFEDEVMSTLMHGVSRRSDRRLTAVEALILRRDALREADRACEDRAGLNLD